MPRVTLTKKNGETITVNSSLKEHGTYEDGFVKMWNPFKKKIELLDASKFTRIDIT